MIVRVILLVAAIFLIANAISYIKKQPPALRRMAMLKCLGVLLIGVIVILAVTGRMHWIGAAIALAIPVFKSLFTLALRLLPFLQHVRRHMGPSVITTPFLKVTIDIGSGSMTGEVLSGTFAGQSLDALDQQQLEGLLNTCKQEDAESARLLAMYMQRRFGKQQYQNNPPQNSSNMNREEALAVLGLDSKATEKDIIAAHRKLMQKLHPDRGGSDYLAAKINQAKDTLIG